MEINLTVILKSKLENREEMKAVLENLVENSRKEAACLQYDLHQNIEDPNIFVFHEVWKNKEGLDLHKEQLYSLKFNKNAEDFLQEKAIIYSTSRIE
jgi:quinol monooxygenase YgiN